MNRDELKKYIEGLGEDAEIIVIKTREQAEVIPHRCERIDVPGRIFWVLRKLVKGTWHVAVVWVTMIGLFPGIPTPKAIVIDAVDRIAHIVNHADYAFPYTSHDDKVPLIAYQQNGNVHYLPPSGLSPEAAAIAGIQITGIQYRA